MGGLFSSIGEDDNNNTNEQKQQRQTTNSNTKNNTASNQNSTKNLNNNSGAIVKVNSTASPTSPYNSQRFFKVATARSPKDITNVDLNEKSPSDIPELLKKKLEMKPVLLKRFGESAPEIFADIAKFKAQFFPKQFIEEKFVLKLIIAQLKRAKGIKQAVADTIAKHASEFGRVHTALQVDKWIIEWTTSGLIVPREMKSTNVLMVIDLPVSHLQDIDSQIIFHRIAKICVDYNRERTYANLSGNCQTFVLDMLGDLGVQFNIGGALGGFLYNLKNDPEGYGRFYYQPKDIVFESHEQLDEFLVNECGSIVLPNGNMNPDNDSGMTEEDFLLLKAFDRAFWLRYTQSPSRENMPTNYCPFQMNVSLAPQAQANQSGAPIYYRVNTQQ